MTLYNCTAYRNGTNYNVTRTLDSGKVLTVVNCVSLGSYGSLGSFAVQQTNSWLSPFSVSSADFVSVDTAGVRGPRKPDGSLPDITFMHLAQGSQLIDAGTNVGLPFAGNAPDLGAFETGVVAGVASRATAVPAEFTLEQNYPNPFNPSTTILYTLPSRGRVVLQVFDVLGRVVRTLVDGEEAAGRYGAEFDGSRLPSGVYLVRAQFAAGAKTRKIVLMK